MTFAEKIITLRAGRGWSQEKLAQELGVTRQAVGRWEKGAGLPDALGLTALARVFDVDTEWLLDDGAAGEPEPRQARRVRIMWFDWLALALAAIALFSGLKLSELSEAYRGANYMYPWYHTFVPLLLGLSAFALGWFCVALICRFLRTFNAGRRAKLAALIVAFVILAILALSDVFLYETLELVGKTVRGLGDSHFWYWLSVKLMELVVHHEALYFIPGALLALIVPRKEIK